MYNLIVDYNSYNIDYKNRMFLPIKSAYKYCYHLYNIAYLLNSALQKSYICILNTVHKLIWKLSLPNLKRYPRFCFSKCY